MSGRPAQMHPSCSSQVAAPPLALADVLLPPPERPAEATGKVPAMAITFDDFLKVDIRVGVIRQAKPFPEACRPAIKLWVDFGDEIGIKKTSAR